MPSSAMIGNNRLFAGIIKITNICWLLVLVTWSTLKCFYYQLLREIVDFCADFCISSHRQLAQIVFTFTHHGKVVIFLLHIGP